MTISFVRNPRKDINHEPKKNNEFGLLNSSFKFEVFNLMPKIFTISTSNGSEKFNIELIKQTSPVISEFIDKNPQILQFRLDISDKFNVINKLARLYQGENVEFNEDEILIFYKISKNLDITCLPKWEFNTTPLIGIKMNSFYNYIKTKELQTFTIKTNKNQYKCNKFGILSSTLIREFLEKNPFGKEYVYDFDDESNEFQIMCDLFNFDVITFSNDNIYLFKKIADELQITFIIDKIDNYIKDLDKLSETIDNQQEIIEKVEEIFEYLYHIREKTVKYVKKFIIGSEWVKLDENVRELAAIIIQVINTDMTLHQYLLDLLIQLDKEEGNQNLKVLMPVITDQLMIEFGKNNCNASFIYNLYKKGIFSDEEIYEKLKSTNQNIYILNWFYPEIKSLSIQIDSSSYRMKKISKFFDFYSPDKIDEYKKMRDNGEPIDTLTIALRRDDVDTFQSIISQSNIEISKGIVPYNIFECFSVSRQINYINYAAFYGSIKCFKYLLLNHAEIDDSTFKYAVFGGNVEIIKIVDQKRNDCSKQDKKIDDNIDFIIPAIQKHQNQIFDWIFETNFSNKNFNSFQSLSSLIKTSVSNGNAYSLIQIIDKVADLSSSSFDLWKNQIQESSQRGFYKINQLIYQIMIQTNKNKSNLRIHYYKSNIKDTDLNNNNLKEYSVSFGNLNILKFYLKFLNYEQKELRVSLLLSIKKDYFKIIKYFFENIINEGFDITDQIVLECLSLSVKKKSNEIFFYLIEQIKKIDPTIFKNFKWYNELLSKSCSYKNLEASKNITELALENDDKKDFTMAFYNAIISESIDICKYFIEKKVFIDYEVLSSQIPQITALGIEFFDLILQNSTEYGKSNFLQFSLEYAI